MIYYPYRLHGNLGGLPLMPLSHIVFFCFFNICDSSHYPMKCNFTSLSLQATADISQRHRFALHQSMTLYSWVSNASGNRFLLTQTLISYFYPMKQVKAVHRNAFKHTGLVWGTFQGYSCMCDAQLESDSAFELREESHPLFGHQYVPVLIYRKCVRVLVCSNE